MQLLHEYSPKEIFICQFHHFSFIIMYISRLIQHISPKLLKRYGIATSAHHQQPQVTLCLLEIFLHLHQHLHDHDTFRFKLCFRLHVTNLRCLTSDISSKLKEKYSERRSQEQKQLK